MGKVTSYQFQHVYQALGMDTRGMGVVMLDLPCIEVRSLIPNFSEDELFYANDPKRAYLGGTPAEEVSHVTLLYGLLENAATTWHPFVKGMLDGWEPEPVRIAKVTTFDSANPEEKYKVIIGELELTPNLLEGRHRLQLLPHIETFPGDYRAHITLAYVKDEPANVDWAFSTPEKWVRSLREELTGKLLPPLGINYGSEPDDA
jgi:hypothetical protein